MIGVELGGALKNVIAIAVRISNGMHMGLNSRAALITRGLAEMGRRGAALGAKPLTFLGLSGITEVAEGVLTTRSTFELAQRHGVDMPITASV